MISLSFDSIISIPLIQGSKLLVHILINTEDYLRPGCLNFKRIYGHRGHVRFSNNSRVATRYNKRNNEKQRSYPREVISRPRKKHISIQICDVRPNIAVQQHSNIIYAVTTWDYGSIHLDV